MAPEHIVIPEGGPHGIRFLATLLRLRDLGYWRLEDIKSMYGTSAGALMSVVLCLDFDTRTLYDYFIRRPWHTAFAEDVGTVGDVILNQGADPVKITRTVLAPLLAAKYLSTNTTLSELYLRTGIDLNIITTKVSPGRSMETLVMNHENHPGLRVIDACARSSALFPFIKCMQDTNCIYIDGGLGPKPATSLSLDRYPYPAKTMAIVRSPGVGQGLPRTLNCMNVFSLVLESTMMFVQDTQERVAVGHSFAVKLPFTTPLSFWVDACTQSSTRVDMFNLGRKDAELGIARHLSEKLI